jgi:hypothetical protein
LVASTESFLIIGTGSIVAGTQTQNLILEMSIIKGFI